MRGQAIRYLATAVATILGLLAATAALAVVVNPYWMYPSAPIAGWTALKPRAKQQAELAKTYMIDRVRPRTLLLGNSRVEIGLDPASRQWPAEDQPVFDGGLAGHDLRAAVRLLRESVAVSPPRLVVVGLDFEDFIAYAHTTTMPPSDTEDARLLVDADGRPNRWRPIQLWKDRLETTVSLDALTDSLATLVGQQPGGATIESNGFNPMRPYAAFVAQDGHHRLFAQKEAQVLPVWQHFRPSDFAQPMRSPQFQYLAQIIDLAMQHDFRLVLFTYPTHQDLVTMIRRLGLWPSFRAWQRAVLRVVDEHAAPDRGRVRLLDFSVCDATTTESVPPAGDTHTHMQWYWEPVHFKRALGERIIARILGGDTGFGYELTDGTIEHVQAEVDVGWARLAAHADAVAEDQSGGAR